MIFCGLKLTHDGAVVVAEDNKLLFSVEIEKLNNNERFSSVENTDLIAEILASHGLSTGDVDLFSVDGWGGFNQDELAVQPRLTIGEEHNHLSYYCGNNQFSLDIAQYRERNLSDNILKRSAFDGLKINNQRFRYESYLHVTGHVMSAYATSPFAKIGEDSYVLVWDGGMFPRLYYVNAQTQRVENFGPIFLLIGNIYTIFSQHFGPFKTVNNFAKDNLSIAGKVMAYIAYGQKQEKLFNIFDQVYRQGSEKPMGFANIFANQVKEKIQKRGFNDEDVLLSFHLYLERLLIEKVSKKMKRFDRPYKNLCFAGGCALNIKWNQALRSSGVFEQVYVPPFPNDSGSAIGMVATSMFNQLGLMNLEWDVYSGPKVIRNEPASAWNCKEFSLESLAKLLYIHKEPVIFLNGNAELGPRALGNRSILADPTSLSTKDFLNEVKKREDYRPVSPICLEEKAPIYFDPGTRDPYMLFDHQIRPEWREKLPAVMHLDNTARLQTVNSENNPVLAELLKQIESLGGLPVLCNTSANHKGTGFFPDVYSATNWGKVNFVWTEGNLYYKKESGDLVRE